MPFHSSAVLPPKHGIGGSRMSLAWYLRSKQRRCRSGEVCACVGHAEVVAFLECTGHKAEAVFEYLRINGISAKGGIALYNLTCP